MKMTKGQLKEILKKEIREVLGEGSEEPLGEITQAVARSVSRADVAHHPESIRGKIMSLIAGLHVEMDSSRRTEDLEQLAAFAEELADMVIRNKEDPEPVNEYGGSIGNVGGVAQNLGAMAGRREPPPLESEPDTVVQARALEFFMDLGLEQKVANAMIVRMAVNDLKSIMIAIPKIGTAAQDEDREHEV